MAELISAVFAKDPDRPGAKPVLFRPGDDVPERFWPDLSRNPALWKDGQPPLPVDAGREGDGQNQRQQDNAEHDTAGDSGDQKQDAKEPDKKPAARGTATKPAARRKAADQGTGGQ